MGFLKRPDILSEENKPENIVGNFKEKIKQDDMKSKFDMYNKISEDTDDKDNSMTRLVASEFGDQLNKNNPYSEYSFLDDPKTQQAIEETGVAKRQAEMSANEFDIENNKLKDRWQETVKDNVNILTNLAGNEKYANWLGGLGLDPASIMKLQRGKDAYIEDFTNEIRTKFNNDVKWVNSLEKIKLQAEKDYNSKVKTMQNEVDRMSKRDETIIAKGDINGVYSLLIRDNRTGKTRVEETSFKPTDKASQPSTFSGILSSENKTVESVLDSIEPDKTYERVGGGNSEVKGECGAVANDILIQAGIKDIRFGNTLGSKDKYVNNRDIQNPKAGMLFVSNFEPTKPSENPEDYGETNAGHVGFIKSVNEDGTVTIVDSNRHGYLKSRVEDVPIENLQSQEGVIGYIDLEKHKAGKVESKVSPEEKVSVLSKASRDEYNLRLKEITKETDTDIRSQKIKAIAEDIDISYNLIKKLESKLTSSNFNNIMFLIKNIDEKTTRDIIINKAINGEDINAIKKEYQQIKTTKTIDDDSYYEDDEDDGIEIDTSGMDL